MVVLNMVRIVDEAWDQDIYLAGKPSELSRIRITATSIDDNLQRADVYFFFAADPDMTECVADICTHESVWSCDFDFNIVETVEKVGPVTLVYTSKGEPQNRFGVDEEELGNALLNFGEHVLGMYS